MLPVVRVLAFIFAQQSRPRETSRAWLSTSSGRRSGLGSQTCPGEIPVAVRPVLRAHALACRFVRVLAFFFARQSQSRETSRTAAPNSSGRISGLLMCTLTYSGRGRLRIHAVAVRWCFNRTRGPPSVNMRIDMHFNMRVDIHTDMRVNVIVPCPCVSFIFA